MIGASAAINATFSAGIVAYAGTVNITMTNTTVTDGKITVENAKVLSIEVSDAAVFVGTNGKLLANHTGLDIDAIHAGGVGFLVEGATFKMVLAKQTSPTGTDVNVITSPALTGPQHSVGIAVNPTNPDNLIIVADDGNPDDGIFGSTGSHDSVWVSMNGGKTWTRKIFRYLREF